MKAGVTNTKAKNKWHLMLLPRANCDWGCPCQFNANPTHGNCEGLSAIHYGRKIWKGKADRLNFIWIASWPGPIHEGHGKASYIDNRASEGQFDKLSTIISGRAKGSAFDVVPGYRHSITLKSPN